jgi:hypothetical protein
VTQIDQAIIDDVSTDLNYTLNATCYLYVPFPGLWCPDLVATVLEYIDDLLEDLVNATATCEALGLCAPGAPARPRRALLRRAARGSPECALCVDFAEWIERAPHADLRGACGLLPQPLAAVCAREIADHADGIAREIAGGESPAGVCGRRGLCAGAVPRPRSRRAVADVTGDGFCGACAALVRAVAEASDRGGAAQEACDAFPDPAGAVCGSIWRIFGEEIAAEIEEGVPLEHICGVIGYCTAPPGYREIVKRRRA